MSTQVKKLRIVSIGTTPMTNKINDLLENLDYIDFVGVVNLLPEKYYHRSNYEPMYGFRARRSEDIVYVSSINSEETIEWLKSKKPDIIIQSGWSEIWRSEVLSIPSMYCLGIHAAPLPLGRGAAILNWKLIEGGGPWGNSIFKMEEKTDIGDILDFEPFELEVRDDIRMAYLKADKTALTMLKRTLPKLVDGTVKPISQTGKKSSRYYKRTPKDGKISFEWSADKIHNYVRGLSHPYPGAFFNSKYGKFIVWSSELGLENEDYEIGTILKIEKGKGVLIQCGSNTTIWLNAIEPELEIEQWADQWFLEKEIIENTNIQQEIEVN